MNETWVRQTDTDCPIPVYCPIDLETGVVMVGLTHLGEPDGEIVGTFTYDKDGVEVRLSEQSPIYTINTEDEKANKDE